MADITWTTVLGPYQSYLANEVNEIHWARFSSEWHRCIKDYWIPLTLPATGKLAPILSYCISISHTDVFGNLLHRLWHISNANKMCFSLSCSNQSSEMKCLWKSLTVESRFITKLEVWLRSLCRGCLVSWQWITNTVKPVCNDHLYDEIYYLWFIQ